MKTEIAENVGRHAFEVAGLGLAPFRFVGASENVIYYPDGTQQAGGTCDYCSTGIRLECHIKSADGRLSKVGCNCIAKVDDAGLLKAYKTSPEFRARARANAQAKHAKICAALDALISANAAQLATEPHPGGFVDRKTGQPLNHLDQVKWLRANCGKSGIASLFRGLSRKFSNA